MRKIFALAVLSFCLLTILVSSQSQGSTTFNTPVAVPQGKSYPTLFDVWPEIDSILKTQYWYYLRGANPLYEASIDTPSEFLFFTIYRNTVGTFLVSTTWDKATQVTQINAFVRLGNGIGSTLYEPVDISPFVINIALSPNEYMVTIDADGKMIVTGNLAHYNRDMNQTSSSFNVTADMNQKALVVDQFNRDQYWYYLNGAQLIAQTSLVTNNQYYFIYIYVNPIGTFLSLSHYNLKDKSSGINTFVRLGDGIPIGANFGPVNLSPSVVSIQTLN